MMYNWRFSLSEYQSLRDEIIQRTSGIEPQVSNVIITMLSVLGVGITLSLGIDTGELGKYQILLSFIRAVIFVVPIFYSLPLAIKSGENLRQIVSISAYIRVFFEYPSMKRKDEKLNWEITNNLMSITNVDRHKKSTMVKFYQSSYTVLAIVSYCLYVLFSVVSITDFYKIGNTALLVCLIIGYTVLAVFSLLAVVETQKNSSIKRNLMDNSEKFIDAYIKRAIEIGLYSKDAYKTIWRELNPNNCAEIMKDTT